VVEYGLGVIGTLLGTLIPIARDYLEKAHAHGQQDVEACQNYLEAARTAVKGLEDVCDVLLLEAKYCDPEQPQQVMEIQKSIDTSLYRDILRPILSDAIEGVRARLGALQQKVDEAFSRRTRENRQSAVNNLRNLLEKLDLYLISLKQGVPPLASGAPASAVQLVRLQEYLNTAGPKDLVQFVNEANAIRSYERTRSLEYTGEIEHIIQELHIAFR
jgi:hypothetical protein